MAGSNTGMIRAIAPSRHRAIARFAEDEGEAEPDDCLVEPARSLRREAPSRSAPRRHRDAP